MSFYNRRKPIAKELRGLMARASWSIRDLAAYLDQPYTTVCNWLNGQVPREAVYDRVVVRLKSAKGRVRRAAGSTARASKSFTPRRSSK